MVAMYDGKRCSENLRRGVRATVNTWFHEEVQQQSDRSGGFFRRDREISFRCLGAHFGVTMPEIF